MITNEEEATTMTAIELISISISNFKGIPKFSTVLDGHDAIISGANATGKTTTYDAFLWLLFGKDSTGAADFDYKPLDADGAEIHNIETCVEATLRINGTPHTLKRVSAEKWSRPRGQTDHVYGGNQSSFWVDEVPRSLTEYKAYVAGMVAEDVFRLITNHQAFNALKLTDRRKALIAISGINVEDKLATEFPGIDTILTGNTPEDAKRRLREVRKRLSAEMDAIPARVDELTRMTTTNGEPRAIERAIASNTESLAQVDAQILQCRAADPVEAARARLSAVQREIAAIERDVNQRHETAKRAAQDDLRRIERDHDYAADQRSDLEICIKASDAAIAERERDVAWMRDEWRKEAGAQYEAGDVDDACPTCGQSLPPDQMEAALEAHRMAHETKKQKRLEEIKAQGKRIGAALDEDKRRAEKLRAELAHWETETDRLTHAVVAASASAVPEPTMPPEHAALVAEASALQAIKPGDDVQLRGLEERRIVLTAIIEQHRINLASIQAAESARTRIEELAAEQRTLGDKVAEVDQQMIKLERYVSARCRLLEEGINALFPTVRWRLFNQLDNGGIEDACDCLIPSPSGAMASYQRSANNGARINAGLEIINVLCGYYGVSTPIFVDNAESVNTLIPTVGQQIQLVVSDDTTLTVKIKEEK